MQNLGRHFRHHLEGRWQRDLCIILPCIFMPYGKNVVTLQNGVSCPLATDGDSLPRLPYYSLKTKTRNMNIEQQLTADVRAAIKALYGQEVPDNLLQLQKTKREFEGHLTLVTFPLLRISRKKPEETAQEIGQYLQETLMLWLPSMW